MLADSKIPALHSYVVRYDSGFAPNPFYGYCTLATCKPDIRRAAQVGDWIIGCGSACAAVNRGGYLVYAMQVSESLSFAEYWRDWRFRQKRPLRTGSMKQSAGDNIYFPLKKAAGWGQLDSFHSCSDGSPHERHIARDTSVDRVLVAQEYYYFGGSGPKIPTNLRDGSGRGICHKGRGRRVFRDRALSTKVVTWLRSLGRAGYLGEPWDWRALNV